MSPKKSRLHNRSLKFRRLAFDVGRGLFRRLPLPIQAGLSRPGHALARRLLQTSKPSGAGTASQHGLGLTWDQFQANVLALRDSYKGVFIQDFTIDWSVPLHQRPQHIATALANRGYLVIYLTGNWANDTADGFHQVVPGLWITDQNVVGRINDSVVSIYSTAYARAEEICRRDKLGYRLVYEYIDHIDPKISGNSVNIKNLEAIREFAFAGGADHVVVSSQRLYEEAADRFSEDKIVLVRNGVDAHHYRMNDQFVPVDNDFIRFVGRFNKIVGYFGAMAPWLWYDCINDLTLRRADIGFVFIGPDYYGGLGRVVARNNVLCTGAINYNDLPAYARSFGVCFIPFELGDIAKTTSPLKLFEYFALEKPVVVTSDMLECTSYPEVLSGSDVQQLSDAIDAAFELSKDPSFKARLSELADQNDWRARAEMYEKVFERKA